MQISIVGQQLSTGQSLQEYVKGKTIDAVHKYFEHAPSAHIHFAKDGHEFHCDIIVNSGASGRHITIKGNHNSDDAYNAFDIALGKLEKQLRKYKGKLNVQRSNPNEVLADTQEQATKYVLSPNNHYDQEQQGDNDQGNNPVIIAKKLTEIMTLSVSEAVMKMDLENLPALMFKNIKNNKISVVYYRKDGNISWVDSE